MKRTHLYAFGALVTAFISSNAVAGDLTAEFDAKHKTCLEQIAVDADLAFEEAMIWQGDGGGRRARHCVAMAYFALGHKEEAARRLEALAKSPDAGTPAMRADHYLEATNFWLLSNKPDEAHAAASAGLDVSEDHIELRIARARAFALMGRYDYADVDLTSALIFDPDHSNALRYRADARHQQGKLAQALADIEKSLALNPDSVETALVRGKIVEAIRLSEVSPDSDDTVE